MGTRAQFFLGDPRDVANREWLGSVAFDGYPDGDIGDAFKTARTEGSFRAAVRQIAGERDDYCDPSTRSFPFPWKDDLFLTDCTYAFFDGAVQFTYFHHGFKPLADFLAMSEEESEAYSNAPDQLASNVPAPTSNKPRGPDSILIVSTVS